MTLPLQARSGDSGDRSRVHPRSMLRVALCASALLQPAAVAVATKCSVMEHGAKGDGKALDSRAIASAITACDHVVFPAGKQFLTGTITLRSGLTLEVEGTILGAAGHILTPPTNPNLPPSPYEGEGGYQDYGHSHWADALLHGDSVSDVTIMGSGTLDGNGALGTGEPHKKDSGKGCKAFGLVRSTGITIRGVTIKDGGWFSILATDCEHLLISGVTIHAARDAIDIMGCRHVFMVSTHRPQQPLATTILGGLRSHTEWRCAVGAHANFGRRGRRREVRLRLVRGQAARLVQRDRGELRRRLRLQRPAVRLRDARRLSRLSFWQARALVSAVASRFHC